ncbi:MAG TPA: hypothetical protein VKA06_09230 [Spirochaetia bacterium]|nr:hypothetical protein [Spirochaetia bacterium]
MHTIHTPRLRLPIHKCASRSRRTLLFVGATISLGVPIALGSCAPFEWGLGPPPVEYRRVVVVIGDHGALHRDAGVHYEVASITDRTIVGFEVGFDLFDDASRPIPGVGRNSFRVIETDRIENGETRRYVVSLDSIPAELYDNLVVSRFRVTRVEFDDGSFWRNSGTHLYEEDDA